MSNKCNRRIDYPQLSGSKASIEARCRGLEKELAAMTKNFRAAAAMAETLVKGLDLLVREGSNDVGPALGEILQRASAACEAERMK